MLNSSISRKVLMMNDIQNKKIVQDNDFVFVNSKVSHLSIENWATSHYIFVSSNVSFSRYESPTIFNK